MPPYFRILEFPSIDVFQGKMPNSVGGQKDTAGVMVMVMVRRRRIVMMIMMRMRRRMMKMVMVMMI